MPNEKTSFDLVIETAEGTLTASLEGISPHWARKLVRQAARDVYHDIEPYINLSFGGSQAAYVTVDDSSVCNLEPRKTFKIVTANYETSVLGLDGFGNFISRVIDNEKEDRFDIVADQTCFD